MNKRLIGVIYLLITAIIWGAAFVAQYYGGIVFGANTFNFFRCVIGALTILIMILILNFIKYKRIIFFTKDEDIRFSIFGSAWCGVVLFFAMQTQQIGCAITDVAKSGLIAGLEVVCVPIYMFLFFKKKIRLFTWIFIILSFVGIALLSATSVSGINKGDIYVFISTLLYSATIIQVPKYIVKIDPFKFSMFRFVTVALMCFLVSIIIKKPFTFKTDCTNDLLRLGIIGVLFSGIFSSGIAYTTQILGQKYCEPVIATLIMGLEGVFAAIFGYILLGQTLNMIQIFGAILTSISVFIVEISDYRYEMLMNFETEI